jgi:hypothetical protein
LKCPVKGGPTLEGRASASTWNFVSEIIPAHINQHTW